MPGRLALRLTQDIGQVAKVRLLCRLDDLGAQLMGAEHANPPVFEAAASSGPAAMPIPTEQIGTRPKLAAEPPPQGAHSAVVPLRGAPARPSFSCAGRRGLLAANPKLRLTSKFTIDGWSISATRLTAALIGSSSRSDGPTLGVRSTEQAATPDSP
jgi:hypothetical protein